MTISDPSFIFLLVGAAFVFWLVGSWHFDEKSPFHLNQFLLDTETGKVAIEKVGYTTVLLIMSWGFVTLTLHDKLTEWYAGVYSGVFVLGRVASKFNKKPEIQPQSLEDNSRS